MYGSDSPDCIIGVIGVGSPRSADISCLLAMLRGDQHCSSNSCGPMQQPPKPRHLVFSTPVIGKLKRRQSYLNPAGTEQQSFSQLARQQQSSLSQRPHSPAAVHPIGGLPPLMQTMQVGNIMAFVTGLYSSLQSGCRWRPALKLQHMQCLHSSFDDDPSPLLGNP